VPVLTSRLLFDSLCSPSTLVLDLDGTHSCLAGAGTRSAHEAYQLVEPTPACAVQRNMSNSMLNCAANSSDKWREAPQLVFNVGNDDTRSRDLSADLSARCRASYKLDMGDEDTKGSLNCLHSSYSPLEAEMLARRMGESNEATGSASNRTVRSCDAIVELGLASGSKSKSDRARNAMHIELNRGVDKSPVQVLIFVADQSGGADAMPFHVDRPKSATVVLDDKVDLDMQFIDK